MTLRLVVGKRDVEDDAVAERVLRNLRFLDECAVFPEYLNAVVRAVADIHEAVGRERRAMYGSEGFGKWCRRIEWSGVAVVRLDAVRTPVTLVCTRVRIEHDDATIAVAVGYVHFVGREIDFGFGGAIQVCRITVAFTLSFTPHLQQELSLACELQHLMSLVRRQPHVVFAVDGDAVHRRGPLVSGTRTAP